MIHQGERLPFGLEARHHLLCIHAELDHFQRHAAPHRLLLFGHVNHTASAFADLLEQFIAFDLLSGFFHRMRSHCRRRLNGLCRVQWLRKESTRLAVGLQKLLHALAQRGIPRASVVQVRGALRRVGQFQRIVENGICRLCRVHIRSVIV
jgi:hypothetical protein